MSGALQWTPNGMVPVRDVVSTGAPIVSSTRRDELDEDDDEVVVASPAPRKRPATTSPLTPKDVLKAARARLREIDAEVKRLKKLERERDELRRLLDAAKNKPRAVVRELPKRSAG